MMKILTLWFLGLSMAISSHAQHVYELSEPDVYCPLRDSHLRMGGTSVNGGNIRLNNHFMSIDGRPTIPVLGEFHYARYPAEQWEEEILKIKAGGVTVIPTYIFWILHEEVEGQFRWDGNRDLRRFLQLCKKHGMSVIIRIGPFCHGEIRNGGLPDWLFAKPLEVRSNDPEYLRYVCRLYNEIGRQVAGLCYKDGGPVIGCQLENEMQHAHAPWAITYPGEAKDKTVAAYNPVSNSDGKWASASDPEMGTKHLRTLKQMAIDAGIVTPFYTVTGWGNAAVIEGETLPVTAAYTYPFWVDKPTMSSFLLFKDLSKEADYAPTRYNPADYPSFCAEMGAGIQMIYSSRPIVTAEAAEGLMVRTLGSGSNGIGYYMYHGGSTPKQQGGVGFMQDEPMGMPKISYDFQAPLGEFGLEGKMYRNLRLLHLFLADFGDQLAPMQTVLPTDWQQMTPENRDDLRYAARMVHSHQDGITSGFLFMINFQDHDTLRHDQTGLSLRLNLRNETLRIPEQGTFTLPKDASVILPFNLNLDGVLLKYATAQLLMKIDDNGTPHYFFFAPEDTAVEYRFDDATVKGRTLYRPKVGLASTFTVKTSDGSHSVKVTTLTRRQALDAAKVNGRLLITSATVLPMPDGAELRSLGNPTINYVLYPSSMGFKTQTISVEPIIPTFEVKRAGPRRMSVSVPSLQTLPQVSDYFLRIHYIGDVAMAFLHGQLVQDEFYHDEPWTIGLKRYQDDLRNEPFTFYFRPLHSVVDVRRVELIPQYKARIGF